MRRFVLVGALVAALVACGLSVTGVAVGEAPIDGGGSSSSSSSSSTSSSSGSVTIGDAGDDASVCDPAFFGPTGTATQTTATAITIDGQLDDWSCSQFSRLDRAHAQGVVNDPEAFVDYALAWEPTNIYFAFRITDTVAPSGTDDYEIWDNDSVELYLGPPPDPSDPDGGHYGAGDLQLIVDWRDDAHVYNNTDLGGNDAGIDGIRSMTSTSDNGFIVEGVIPSAFFGGALQPSQTLAFDVALNERRNSTRMILFNYQRDAGTTFGGCGTQQQSACNTLLWGALTLSP